MLFDVSDVEVNSPRKKKRSEKKDVKKTAKRRIERSTSSIDEEVIKKIMLIIF